MPTNDFMEFATSSAAYVESLADYTIDSERIAGQQSGIARADLNNRALRQGSAMAAAIGSFMNAQGYNARDDGNTATRASDFAAAVAALITPNITSAVNAAKVDVLKKVFPVGSFYVSYNVNTNPSGLLGFGTWSPVQGRFLIGASSAYPAASTGGAATHAITVSELPAHSHTASTASAGGHTHTATSASAGAHTHSVSGTAASAGAHTHTGTAASAGEHTHSATAATAGAHTHTATTSTGGAHTHTRGTMNITGSIIASDTDGEILIAPDQLSQTGALYVSDKVNRQGPFSSSGGTGYQGINFDASRSWTGNTNSTGGHTHTLTTSSDGAHTHTLTVVKNGAHTHSVSVTSAGAHTHSVSATAASAGAHTHGITIASAGAHTHSVTVANTGGGSAMSLLPPYMAVYMWRRTA